MPLAILKISVKRKNCTRNLNKEKLQEKNMRKRLIKWILKLKENLKINYFCFIEILFVLNLLNFYSDLFKLEKSS